MRCEIWVRNIELSVVECKIPFMLESILINIKNSSFSCGSRHLSFVSFQFSSNNFMQMYEGLKFHKFSSFLGTIVSECYYAKFEDERKRERVVRSVSNIQNSVVDCSCNNLKPETFSKLSHITQRLICI